MKTVFVSSTSAGLVEYRAKAIEAIRGMNGYSVVAMEHFGARPDTPIDTCYAMLAQCDLYLGLIGHCYGSCPDGEQHSFTELEYKRAAEMGIPRLMFLQSEEAALQVKDIESDEEREKQRQFRKSVSDDLARAKFESPHDLQVKVLQSLSHLAAAADGGLSTTLLLYPFVTTVSGFDTQIQIANVGVAPFHPRKQFGSCKLYFYGERATDNGDKVLIPISLMTGKVSAGATYAWSLYNGSPDREVMSVIGFMGFLLISCPFVARGVAFVSKLGSSEASACYQAEDVSDWLTNSQVTDAPS